MLVVLFTASFGGGLKSLASLSADDYRMYWVIELFSGFDIEWNLRRFVAFVVTQSRECNAIRAQIDYWSLTFGLTLADQRTTGDHETYDARLIRMAFDWCPKWSRNIFHLPNALRFVVLAIKGLEKDALGNMGREKLTRIDDRDFDYWCF